MRHTFAAERYTIRELRGIGSTARVYRAHDRVLEREVALKILTDPHTADLGSLERFYREARSTASLGHPRVVSVYDLGRTGEGRPYMAMEYVSGGTLKHRLLREDALPPAAAVGITYQVCEALAAAHARGMVHRDIKPQNVLLTAAGDAKLADFGISGAIGEVSVLGTANYASPEQCLGEALGPMSDLYSLGVILYEMLTGKKPFSGETPQAIAASHVRDVPPRPAEIRPGLPEELDALVTSLLAKNPAHRCGNRQEETQEPDNAAGELAVKLKRLRKDLFERGPDPNHTAVEREGPGEQQTGGPHRRDVQQPVPATVRQARIRRRRRLLRSLGASAAALVVAATLFASSDTAVSESWPANVFGISAEARSGGESTDDTPAVSRVAAEKVFVHRATPENTFANSTYLDHPEANGNAGAIISVTQNWNPEEVYNDHPVGVWYNADAGRWAIFNQDMEPVKEGTAFNVLVLEGSANR